MAATAEQN